jgi:hypothetical protein
MADDLLFWILFVGGMASEGLECRRWFVVRLRETADRLGITGWDAAFPLLDGFFFLDRSGENYAGNLWEEVQRTSNSAHKAINPKG